MSDNSTYRLIDIDEEEYVYELILRVFHRFVAPTYSKDGIDTFTDMLSPLFLVEKKTDKLTVVSEFKGQIAGVLTVINASHIALLFVDHEFQGQGISKGLIRYGIDLSLQRCPDLDTITVSSSPNSTSFYRHTGFEAVVEEKEEDGMRFLPMGKKVSG